MFRITGENYAHRAMLVLKLSRALTPGLVVAHECTPPYYENSRCVHPEHLHERTKSENALWLPPGVRSEVFGGPDKGTRFAQMNRERTAWSPRRHAAFDAQKAGKKT
jgi:hypothetical protein